MTWFRRWWRARFANASTSAVDRADVKENAEDDGKDEEKFFSEYEVEEKTRLGADWVVVKPKKEVVAAESFVSKYEVCERTRNGDYWVVVSSKGDGGGDDGIGFFDQKVEDDLFVTKYMVTEKSRYGESWLIVHLVNEINNFDDFFDLPLKSNTLLDGAEFYVTERRRSGEVWIVLEHAKQQDLKLSCDYCEEDDFFENNSPKKNIANALLQPTKPSSSKILTLKTEYQFVVTERTHDGHSWVVVDHLNNRLPTNDDFFDPPPQPDGSIPDSQLVVTNRTRLGEPWCVIDLPAASSSKSALSEDNAFFDLLPIIDDGKNTNWLQKKTKKFKKPIANLQEYFHLNDCGDLRVINFGVKVQKGWDSCNGPWKWWQRIPLGREAKEEKRSLWGRFVRCLKRFWRKYVSSPRTANTNGTSTTNGACQQPLQGVRKGEPPGIRVRRYALQLARDKSTTFAQNVDHFIACTRDGRERQPHVVMRNMRQFMSGMKNYLLKHGERGFEREVQLARARLRGDEFLNLDALLESVMQKLVAVPLREHLYALFVEWCATRGDIELMAENIKLAAEYEPRELGLRACVTPPNGAAMNAIAEQFNLLQEAESPLDKLDKLLRAVALVFEGTGGIKVVSADDFLPLLILVIARCGMVGAEIESEIMWGLLQPSLLSGEAGYYLTALSSAVHVLKSLGAGGKDTTATCFVNGTTAANSNLGNNPAGDGDRPRLLLPACGSLLRVVVPDEHNGSLQTRTLPVRPHTTAKEVCRIIAHRARVTNPQDYGLFKLVDGEESLLGDGECPQEARMSAEGKHCVLAYKRIDAKIAWPTQVTSDEDC